MRQRGHRRMLALAGGLLGAFCLAGCSTSPGRPAAGSETVAPNEVADFAALYGDNCAGCHGAEGKGGAAIALADPVYLAIADDATIRKVITSGVPKTPMPAFAQSAGGMLTAKQVQLLVSGVRTHWGKPGAFGEANLPPAYSARSTGDAARGGAVYETYCQACHGALGRGGAKGSAIADTSFLALVSDQYLRTVIITGRPELGAPDWRGDVPGKAMSEQEVSDVVVWLGAQRVNNPGQPYPAASVAKQQ